MMFFDRRSAGRGLTVGADALALNDRSAPLRKHDRLIPQPGLEDVGHYAVVDTPCWLKFWRPSRATLTTLSNPVFKQGPAGAL
eukprot:9328558-Pyramimonas_sp.AAC.1